MKDKFTVIYSPQSREDLKKIYDYICFKLGVKESAGGQITRIIEQIEKLNIFPSRYQIVDCEPWCSMGVRQIPIDNYIVFYTVDNENMQVSVLRIFYSARNVENLIE